MIFEHSVSVNCCSEFVVTFAIFKKSAMVFMFLDRDIRLALVICDDYVNAVLGRQRRFNLVVRFCEGSYMETKHCECLAYCFTAVAIARCDYSSVLEYLGCLQCWNCYGTDWLNYW